MRIIDQLRHFNIVQMLRLFVIVTLIGYLLFQHYQPACEPCLPEVYCPPCRAKEQYIVQFIFGAIDTLIFCRIVFLIFRKKK